MADAESVATLIDSTTSKIQQLQKVFTELESHRAISLNLKWIELEEHFHGLEMSLKKRFNELKDQEMEYRTKESEARRVLEKQTAVVVAKEQASLEQLQVKRDAALSVIDIALGKCKKSTDNFTADRTNDHVDSMVEEKPSVKAEKVDNGSLSPVQNEVPDPRASSPLFELCKEMDANGLHKFISDNRKNLASIREEIPAALRSAPNPFHLVLDSLKDFYTADMPIVNGKKESSLIGIRRTCLMLLESFYLILADTASGSDTDILITSDIKAQAKVIADEWKAKLDDLNIGMSSGNSLEVHAFLQLLATFDIASDFDQDEICTLIPYVSHRRQAADLCRSLGLLERMPVLIEALVNGGKQIEAVNLAYAFGLTEKFSPVPLLKAYLKEAKKVRQVKVGNMSPGGQNETDEAEISALKAIIKCVEEHKLENQYPLDPLKKRILLLEKAKADKKRVTEVSKPHSKRPRANGINRATNGCGYVPRIATCSEKSFYRAPERYPYAYDRQYIYPTETHASPLMSSPSYGSSYNPSPPTQSHGGYYSNTYQYHLHAPYIH